MDKVKDCTTIGQYELEVNKKLKCVTVVDKCHLWGKADMGSNPGEDGRDSNPCQSQYE